MSYGTIVFAASQCQALCSSDKFWSLQVHKAGFGMATTRGCSQVRQLLLYGKQNRQSEVG
jgi:hypothetical protein